MTPTAKPRTVLDVLREHPEGLTPEALFTQANYPPDKVDDFYADLALVAHAISEERPNGAAAFQWPERARIILRLKRE
jgi:hypothetical protein